MSKDGSSVRFVSRNASKSVASEGNENEFENESNAILVPPPRTPLNTIPDPAQFQKEIEEFDFESRAKFEVSRSRRLSDKKIEVSCNAGGLNYGTSRVSGRGKAQSEPNSAQSTPARTAARISIIGASSGACTGPRPPQHSGSRGGSSSRVYRGIQLVNIEQSTEVPHFELVDDPLFWEDHNVQVLIRIRPLSNAEMMSQGYGRCLKQESAQTLVWLGHPETRFTFDHIACETISQEKLFMIAGLPMVDNCMSGYNSCMFAYGQTGSGKTYTMIGDICHRDGNLNEDCGITPRIFEYLFTRIREEEGNRRDERLKYSCKCSFLEIYNEQITDLLEPSSTNLQLREDLKKGVYVENLTEHGVTTVNDVLKLLLQGAANRKMAATNMNSESSRSHSVFTCTIESHWEKDSMTHRRFGRLNLVDLAGSERQKSSGAEGDRLKEAVNINKSLSTLGLVIMSLVDLTHGKHRHVPYRDSRLTFLLQDSLGGNSKTTIIANVSPSICSANETLSTLKFAQRAKLIQNNANVNEDASGNITALQRQIKHLQGQLSFLVKHYDISKSVSSFMSADQWSGMSDTADRNDLLGERNMSDDHRTQSVQEWKVQQREEDIQHAKMMLRFREEKIKRLELFADGLICTDKYLIEENNSLKEEIQFLQERIDRKPEVTRFALECIRILDQLKALEAFHEQGERETLLAEISELRDQLLESLEGDYCKNKIPPNTQKQDIDEVNELKDCKNMNCNLIREVDALRAELTKYYDQAFADPRFNYPLEFKTDKHLLAETLSIRSNSGDEMACYDQQEGEVLQDKNDEKIADALIMQSSYPQKELMHARSLTEPMESEEVLLIKDPQFMQENYRCMEIVSNNDLTGRESMSQLENCYKETSNNEKLDFFLGSSKEISTAALQAKLDRMSNELEKARLLNCQYQEDQALQLSQKHQSELVCEQVEMETAKTILHLQEEVSALQSELEERLCYMSVENVRLKGMIAAKENEIRELSSEWENATLELTSFLMEGSKSLRDASSQIENIACSFPHVNVWLGEHIEKAAKVCVEKEETILQLQKSLENAQEMVWEMEQKLNSLKGATVALAEVHHGESNASMKETVQLSTVSNSKIKMIEMSKNKLMYKEGPTTEAVNSAQSIFLEEKGLSDCAGFSLRNNIKGCVPMLKLAISPEMSSDLQISEMNVHGNALTLEDIDSQVQMARMVLLESQSAIYESYANTEMYISALRSDIDELSSLHRQLVLDFLKNIQEMRKNFVELNDSCKNCQSQEVGISSVEGSKHENLYFLLHQIREELVQANDSLNVVKAWSDKILNMNDLPVGAENLVEIDKWSVVCSTSDSDLSAECVARKKNPDLSSSTWCYDCPGEITEWNLDLDFDRGSILSTDDHESEELEGLLKASTHDETTILCLRKELEKARYAFNKLNIQLATLINEKEIRGCSYTAVCFHESLGFMNHGEQPAVKNGLNQHKKLEFITNEKINEPSNFFTKFEEARVTMKEADIMLNELLKANEYEKQLTGFWKQAGEELMMEKTSLINEIEQLKSVIHAKDGEIEELQNQIHYGFQETENSVSLLEGSFLHMQGEVEEMYKSIHCDVVKMAQDVLHGICNSRSYLEDICSDTMEQRFSSFVQYLCHVEGFFRKFPSRIVHTGLNQDELQESCLATNETGSKNDILDCGVKGAKGDHMAMFKILEDLESATAPDNLMGEYVLLKKELTRKEAVLKGLFFDFSLLQESASTIKDMKDENARLIVTLSQVQQELKMKTDQLNDVLSDHAKLEDHLANTEAALFISNSDLEQAKGTVDVLTDQIAELRVLLKDIYLRKSEVEEQLEEQREVVQSLEKEILRTNSSVENGLTSIEDIEDDLRRVTIERDQLQEDVWSLQDKLEMAYSVADEKEAIAVEARQESEARKVYAEQKEEEVKILEHSVQELECTIDVLEKKAYEMEEEVQKHKLIRDSLELELQALKQRMLTVEGFTENMGSESSDVEQQPHYQILRQLQNKSLELLEANKQISVLEEEIVEQAKEMKQCKEYISELILHAEAQASQYQHKYKELEAMVREVKSNSSTLTSATLTLDKSEKISMRPRGSSSPFRCIASLVQQMNVEKDQELAMARLCIEELEELAASRQKEVCTLNSRLAAAESMTHDVIRDLLRVKLDMTNYADLIDQYQLQKIVVDAQIHAQESVAMEQEILNLRRQINDLVEDRERCISELNRRQADVLASQVTIEQLQEREQLLIAQNEMFKVDNGNLKRKTVELDEMLKKIFRAQNVPPRIQKQMNIKECSMLKWQSGTALQKQLENKPDGREERDRLQGHATERRIRRTSFD
ncbi:kinesin-like protein KIN-12C [Diospyros lotus]|uniref:kinesin-like protein KIN-12C n=1 Tax=Diospyros lotus TaxID=55363 RepID=UPI002250747A|nr:kinesin-like protein KIN-12C [Diospyros lotus]